MATGLKWVMEGPLLEWDPSKKNKTSFSPTFFEEPLSEPGWALSSLGWVLWGLELALADPVLTLENLYTDYLH